MVLHKFSDLPRKTKPPSARPARDFAGCDGSPRFFYTFVVPNHGELSEWLKEPASKTGVRQRTGGSNPSLTALCKANQGRRTLCGVFVYWSDRQELALVRAFQYAKRDEVSPRFALLAVTEGCGRTQCDQIPRVRDTFRPFGPQNCHAGTGRCGRRPKILEVNRKNGQFCGRRPGKWDVFRTLSQSAENATRKTGTATWT